MDAEAVGSFSGDMLSTYNLAMLLAPIWGNALFASLAKASGQGGFFFVGIGLAVFGIAPIVKSHSLSIVAKITLSVGYCLYAVLASVMTILFFAGQA